jgi:hypothetical protein
MKIAIIDSGVAPAHPHLGSIAGGIGIVTENYLDRLGHGTAVAAAIREKAPNAELYAVKVFDRKLSASIDAIVRALEWCHENHMDVINLSLGTANYEHRERFENTLRSSAVLVSAANLLPGNLPGVIAVSPDEHCPRDAYSYRDEVFYASPYPRPMPGVPVERNLSGISFAVANMTGFVGRVLEDTPRGELLTRLIAGALAG